MRVVSPLRFPTTSGSGAPGPAPSVESFNSKAGGAITTDSLPLTCLEANAVIVLIGYRATPDPSGVTYAGLPLTHIIAPSVVTGAKVDAWGLLGAPAGTANIVVTFPSATVDYGITVVGVKHAGSVGTPVKGTSFGGSPFVLDVPSVSQALLLDIHGHWNTYPAPLVGPGQTEISSLIGSGVGHSSRTSYKQVPEGEDASTIPMSRQTYAVNSAALAFAVLPA